MQTLHGLGELILEHWTTHRPRLTEELRVSNQLHQAILEAQRQTADLLYELTVIHKMDYHSAWELATREWAFPPAEPLPDRPSLSQSPNPPLPPATSA